MPLIVEPRYVLTVHPLHALFLAGMMPLFLGATVADLAYANTFQIQWNNFASWLLAGALVFAGVALAFAIAGLFMASQRARGIVPYAVVLIVTWVVGFFSALIHARDAWGSMPTGLVLSAVATILACAALWLGFRTPHIRGAA